jgi:polyadenylate-binding protein
MTIRELNQTVFEGKPCRVVQVQHDDLEINKEAKIYVTSSPLSLTGVDFHNTFSEFGEILSSKLVVDPNNVSNPFGFIQYVTAEEAEIAIQKTKGVTLDMKYLTQPISTSFFYKQEKLPWQPPFHNVYFRNLPKDITPSCFDQFCKEFGPTNSTFLKKDANRKPMGIGFANFSNTNDTANLVEIHTHGATHSLCLHQR